MKYYYLDGIEKKGPYTLEEILSRNLSSDTMIYREDKTNWLALSDFEELNVSIIDVVDKSENYVIEDEEQKEPVVKNVAVANKRSLFGRSLCSVRLLQSVVPSSVPQTLHSTKK